MKNSIKVLLLCVVIMFGFAGVSSAKTKSEFNGSSETKASLSKFKNELKSICLAFGKACDDAKADASNAFNTAVSVCATAGIGTTVCNNASNDALTSQATAIIVCALENLGDAPAPVSPIVGKNLNLRHEVKNSATNSK